VAKPVYDFVDTNGHNVIAEWLTSLDKVMRAKMQSKLDVLLMVDTDLPPKMLTDTNEPQIKELCVNSKEALRLLLCKGPAPDQKNKEITLLFGAKERDKRYVPRNALALAEANRKLVLSNSVKHRVLRKADEDADSKTSTN
jgi:hypothetical protein